MAWAQRDGERTAGPRRAAGLVRIGLAAAVAALGAYFVESDRWAVLLGVGAFTTAVVLTANDWLSYAHKFNLYVSDQALELHRQSLYRLADATEAAVRRLEPRARRSDRYGDYDIQ